jgi:hypothetical protein
VEAPEEGGTGDLRADTVVGEAGAFSFEGAAERIFCLTGEDEEKLEERACCSKLFLALRCCGEALLLSEGRCLTDVVGSALALVTGAAAAAAAAAYRLIPIKPTMSTMKAVTAVAKCLTRS